MTFTVETRRGRRTVALQREGDAWRAEIDGRTRVVRVAGVGGRWSMLIDGSDVASGLSRTADVSGSSRVSASYEIAFEAGAVLVNGNRVPVSVIDPRARFRRGREAAAHGGNGPASVVAPMPGRIVKLLVAPGDAVTARQGLLVVEAMKMENELRAPRAGTVTAVRVAEGASVEANAVLVVIE